MNDAISAPAKEYHSSTGRSVRKWLCSTSLVVLAAAMPVGAVHAQEWTGGVSTDWGTGGNWQGGALPTAVSDVFINNEGAGWPIINGGTRVANSVVIGNSADGGNLRIMGGGVLNTSDFVDIGLNNIGSAIVTGGGSVWNIASHLELGFVGTGTLTISNNGRVNSQDGYLSNRVQGSGTANVNSGGTWINSRDLLVGYQGTGALNIASAGVVAANGTTYVGFYGPGTGAVTIEGANSLLTTGGFVVGVEGQGNVTVTNDGIIESASGIIGEIAGSTGTVNLQSDSQWNVDTAITVGAAGAGTLIVGSGADVTSQMATVGRNAGGTGTVMFIGSGSSWTNSGDFTIARDGRGIMSLGNAATVNSGLLTIGQNAGSTGSLAVSGVGRWTSSDAVVVGEAGNGKLRVDTLGQIASNGGSIGSGEGAAGTVEIVGAPTPSPADRSMWNAGNSATVTVGGAGGQGSLFVSNDGVFHSGGLDISASDANGHTGSAIMTISSDADVTTANTGAIGSYAGSAGSVTVSGSGSAWDSSMLVVGSMGTGSLRVEDRGFVLTQVGRIGFGTGSQGSVTVTGEGSLLRATTSLFVGDLGQGSLTVENGGDVRSTGGRIGLSTGGSGAALVTGNGSQWDARSGTLAVGDHGNASLTVADRGLLMADTVNVGAAGFATVTASGSATVQSANLNIGYVAGRNGTVALTGSGTSWTVSNDVSVGLSANGGLTIANGASLISTSGSKTIGNGGGATGSVIITGANSVWDLGSGTVLVGGSGTGSLTVENGGQLLGDVDVMSGGTLRGNGTVGNTAMTSGSTLIGVQGQALTVNGDLSINTSAADVNVSLGAPGNATGLFNVTGNLILNGTLNVSNAGGFGAGLYRIFDYGGSLTDNGLNLGVMPSGTNGTVQTAVANQVNLLVSGVANDTQFWNGTTTTADGTIHGGNGNWVMGPSNWTDANGTATESWGSQFAVFQNSPGIVAVDNQAGAVTTTGMQFIGDGWYVGGQTLTLDGSAAAGTSSIRVGDGTAAGANWTATIGADLTGSSGLVKNDLGTLVLTGSSSYTGGTTIAAGTLQIGDGGTTGSISGLVDNAGTLAFNRSNSYALGGQIVGTGAIRQIGSGTTTLTGNSSSFTGSTTVENGILAVNGQLGGSLSVQSGGRLQGTGTVGNTIVSGVIAPGNSIGTLNVGNITFNGGSIYEVEVNAAGQTDLIRASGTATINGGLVQVLAGSGNYMPQTQYTILTATGGRTGTFAGGVTSNLAFLDPSLSYDANNVYLTMTRNDISFQNVGVTPNQIATGGGVESLGLGNSVYDAVLNLSAPQAQYAFDQLSGEIHASAKTAMLEDSRFIRNAVNDRIRAAFDGVGASNGNVVTYDNGKPQAVAATTDGGAVWGHAFGAWGHWNGDGNAARLDRSIGGFFVGADAPAFDTWRFGAVAGYSRTSFDAKDRHSSGTSDNYHVGLYGGTTWGDLAFRTGAAYTWHDISTNRSATFTGFGNSLTGDYGASTAQVFGELGYKMQAGNVAFEPFANLAYVNLHTEGFTEKGGAAALTSGSSSTDATFTTLGLRAASSFNLGDTVVTAKGMVGWRHAFGDVTPNSVMRFAGGGDSFTIGGVPIARNAAVVEAGLDFALSPTATLGVSYGGQFGSGVVDQSVRANFNVKF